MLGYSNIMRLQDSALLNGINFFSVDRDRPGAFVPLYLHNRGWREENIGAVMFLKSLAALIAQMPLADRIDNTRHKKWYALCADLIVATTGIVVVFNSSYALVCAALILQGVAYVIMSA